MGVKTVEKNGQVPEGGTQVDLQAAFEALRFQAGQEVSRLMTEIAMRDALITQLQAQLEEAQLARIEAQNPGIDREQVRAERAKPSASAQS